ncbi:MAG: BlaI/MecI/CopY family transcriptional regulator [Planctomycetota bacterium]
MSDIQPNISDAEWRIMHEIWRSEPVTSNEIIQRLSSATTWTAGTIKTLLHRLVEKDVISFQRKGIRYLYRSNFSQSECIDIASNQLLHTVFKSQPLPMLKYLVHSARLSGKEVENLREILGELQEQLPQSTIQNTPAPVSTGTHQSLVLEL